MRAGRPRPRAPGCARECCSSRWLLHNSPTASLEPFCGWGRKSRESSVKRGVLCSRWSALASAQGRFGEPVPAFRRRVYATATARSGDRARLTTSRPTRRSPRLLDPLLQLRSLRVLQAGHLESVEALIARIPDALLTHISRAFDVFRGPSDLRYCLQIHDIGGRHQTHQRSLTAETRVRIPVAVCRSAGTTSSFTLSTGRFGCPIGEMLMVGVQTRRGDEVGDMPTLSWSASR